MKKIILAVMFVSTVLVGCSSQQSGEKVEKKADVKAEKPVEINVANVSTLSFKEVDINEDGRFTYDEFDEITKNKGSADGNTVYADFDVDGNGIISEKEFKAKK